MHRVRARGEASKKRVHCEKDLNHREFESIQEAAGFLNRCPATVYDAIKKRRRIDGFAVEYVSNESDKCEVAETGI